MVVAEFTCVECGTFFTESAAQAEPAGRCGVCLWLDAMADTRDRDSLRSQLLRIGLIGPAG